MTDTPRWFTDNPDDHSHRYAQRFRELLAEGQDIEGEARFVDAIAARGSKILDAGCGAGRVAGALQRMGHQVQGVDVDPVLVEAARQDHPDVEFHQADLATLDLPEKNFDLVVCAGNVMVFLAPGTELKALSRMAAHVVPGGRLVFGFRHEDIYPLERFDQDCASLGLQRTQRFSTWHLDPYDADGGYAVTVLRRP